jgi:carbon monoxide dehydrogenase subunit G
MEGGRVADGPPSYDPLPCPDGPAASAARVKKAKVGCGAVVALALLGTVGFGLFGSRQWRVERTATIRAAPEAVHERIADLRRWKEWSRWIADANPSAAFVYAGEPGLGMTASWTSARGHACSLAITRSDPATGIEYDLALGGFPTTAHGALALEATPDGGATRLTWTTWGERSDRLGALFARLIGPLLGRKLAADLARLREQLEPPG